MGIDRLCEELVASGVAPTAAAGWARRRHGRWELSVGGATRAVFDLASVTKPITAMTVASLAARGAGGGLDRATPLGALLDEARGTASESATVELLLAHRAGLEAHIAVFRSLVEGRPFDRAAALIEALNGRRRECVGPIPAEGFPPVYSDLGYFLVGEALRRRSQTGRLDDVLPASAELGSVRRLRALVPDLDARLVPTEVVPWRGGELRGQVHDENAWALGGDDTCGHAGMFGTIEGVLRFGCEAHDAIARDPAYAWLAAPRAGGTLRAGFDGKSETGSSAGERMSARAYGHLGFTGTSLWIDPDAEVVVALLTNRVHPTRDNVAIRAARPRVHDALFAMATGLR